MIQHQNNLNRLFFAFVCLYLLFTQLMSAQESVSEFGSKNTYHNQLYFNRFFLNPTFSLIRENKSYLNLLHRNQFTTFEDNRQNYFLGFGNKLNDKTAIGLGIYSQWSGVVQEFGFNANYATAVKLGDKSQLAFGTNITYFTESLDKNRVIIASNDTRISEAKKESKLAIQPGLTLSLGNFDFSVFAKNLFRYNQTTNSFLTNLSTKSINTSVQYTHTFNAQKGLFENARLMPLFQLGKNNDNKMTYTGSLLLDLPNYGWLQTNYDDIYGMSLGMGFNINKNISLGYLMEKNILQKNTVLGWNHEVSLGYTLNKNSSSEEWAENSVDKKIDRIIRNYESQILQLTAEKNQNIESEISTKKIATSELAYENRLILDQLILRQDSINAARDAQFEEKFEMIVRAVRTDIKNNIKSNLKNINTLQTTALVNNLTKKADAQKEEYSNNYELPAMKVFDQANIVGAKSGYYVIANVYKNKKYLENFIKKLKEKGLHANKLYNKENDLYYVYLANFNFKSEAQKAYFTNLNGRYRDEKWIMKVSDNSSIAHN